MKRLVLDLDNTLTLGRGAESADYADIPPNAEVVEKVRAYRAAGFSIAIYTSRNMRTHNNSIGHINAKTLPVIVEWLNQHNIPFDEIYVGKPWCGTEGFYVDDKAIRPDEFLTMSYEEISRLIGDKS